MGSREVAIYLKAKDIYETEKSIMSVCHNYWVVFRNNKKVNFGKILNDVEDNYLLGGNKYSKDLVRMLAKLDPIWFKDLESRRVEPEKLF